MILPRLRYEEKEFGVIQDIHHSGVKRTYKKWVGRGRRALAKKIAAKNNQLGIANQEAYRNLTMAKNSRNLSPADRLHEGELIRAAIREEKAAVPNVRVISNLNLFGPYLPNYTTCVYEPETVKEVASQLSGYAGRRMQHAAQKGERVITIPKITSPGEVIHEFEHLRTRQGNGIISKLARRGGRPEVRREFNSALTQNIQEQIALQNQVARGTYAPGLWKDKFVYEDARKAMDKLPGYNYSNKTGFGTALRQYIDSKAILVDERAANRNALKRLKSLQRRGLATKADVQTAKQLLDAGYQTYIPSTGIPWRTTLENTIQIPSRRR